MKKSILWGSVTLFLFYLFYDLIPLGIYSSWLYLIVIVGAVAVSASLLAFVIHTFYPKSVEAEGEDAREDNAGCVYAAILIGGIFGLGFLFIYHENDREISEFRNYGVYTTATVTDGSSYTVKRTDFTSLSVEFISSNGKRVTGKVSISKHQFDRYYQRQRIPIVYSSRYPQLLRLASEEEFIKHYEK
jgi:hypothetical protein